MAANLRPVSPLASSNSRNIEGRSEFAPIAGGGQTGVLGSNCEGGVVTGVRMVTSADMTGTTGKRTDADARRSIPNAEEVPCGPYGERSGSAWPRLNEHPKVGPARLCRTRSLDRFQYINAPIRTVRHPNVPKVVWRNASESAERPAGSRFSVVDRPDRATPGNRCH